MRAGRLRHRVAIEQRVETPDTDGDLITSWTLIADEVPAEIVPLSARELMAAQATQSEVSVRITIRWRAGLKANMRVRRLDDGRVYNVAGIVEDNCSGREWITLPCSEGVNDG